MRRISQERGQTTAEYALVLLAAATIAVLLIRWATTSSALTGFFEDIISKIIALV